MSDFGFCWHDGRYWCKSCTREVPPTLLERHGRVCDIHKVEIRGFNRGLQHAMDLILEETA